MSIVYTYDGSFDGLLTCIYDYYYSKKKAEDIKVKDDFFLTCFRRKFLSKPLRKKVQRSLMLSRRRLAQLP